MRYFRNYSIFGGRRLAEACPRRPGALLHEQAVGSTFWPVSRLGCCAEGFFMSMPHQPAVWPPRACCKLKWSRVGACVPIGCDFLIPTCFKFCPLAESSCMSKMYEPMIISFERLTWRIHRPLFGLHFAHPLLLPSTHNPDPPGL